MNEVIQKDTLSKNNKQIAHDLQSPLSALNFISSMNPDLPQASRKILEMAIGRLQEIADGLDGLINESF